MSINRILINANFDKKIDDTDSKEFFYVGYRFRLKNSNKKKKENKFQKLKIDYLRNYKYYTLILKTFFLIKQVE